MRTEQPCVYAATGADTGLLTLYSGSDVLTSFDLVGRSYDGVDFRIVNSGSGAAVSVVAPVVTEALANATGAPAYPSLTSDDILKGTADPNATVHFAIDGIAVAATAATDANGLWTFYPDALPDGSHTIVASETNAADLTGSASVTFQLDTAQPSLAIAAVPTILSSGTLQAQATISGTVADAGAGVGAVSLYAGTVAPENYLGDATIIDGSWTFSTPLSYDTPQTFTAVATDLAGNSTTASATYQSALASLQLSSSAGTLTANGDDYTLDLGAIQEGSAGASADVSIANVAAGFADALSGSLVLVSDTGVSNSGSGQFAVGPGGAATVETVAIGGNSVGQFAEVFDIVSVGGEALGTLTVKGAVNHTPAPALSVSQVATPLTGLAGGSFFRFRQAVDITGI